MDEDLAFALQLNQQINDNEDFCVTSAKETERFLQCNKNKAALSITDGSWELIDPVPDIRELFVQFNAAYFDGLLAGIEVKWSSRMTLCAGVCCYEGRGGLCSVKLSAPLLKLRPRSDLINTLLHEMIHALLFVTDNNKDHDGHGAEFHKHMYRINKQTGSNITVYHTFHDEVNNYRQHWWRCDGPCVKRPPFYGIVRRAMNRAPAPRDPWFKDHQVKCGGKFIKIKEPEKNLKKKNDKKTRDEGGSSDADKKTKENINKTSKPITNFFKKTSSKDDVGVKTSSDTKLKSKHGDLLKNDLFWTSNTTKSSVKGFHGNNDSNNSSNIYAGSTQTDSSNIHGFKMSANKKLETNIDTFAGKGFKMKESATISSREAFLKKMEADISSSKKRKLEDNRDRTNDFSNKLTNNTIPGRTSSNNQITNINKRTKKSENVDLVSCNRPSDNMTKDLKTPYDITEKNDVSTSSSYVGTSSNNIESTSNKIHKVNQEKIKSKNSISEVIVLDDSLETDDHKVLLVDCPACPAKIPAYQLNRHLDTCLV